MSNQNGDRTREIEQLIEAHYKGEKHAIKRKFLLPKLQGFIPDLTDRDMRKAYETLVLCWGNGGIYAPATEGERDDQIKRFDNLIISYAQEKKRLKNYQISKEPQMNLFGG